MSDIYITDTDGMVKKVSIEEAFPFLREKGHMISLVGGGGKTTLMYMLAWEYQKRGMKTLVTTTTHIVKPQEWENIFARDMDEVQRLWEQGRIVVIGTDEKTGKLAMPEGTFLGQAGDMADVILIEADGAKCLPCKVPEDFEPVLLPASDIVIGVMGLDTVGERLGDICFRKERAMELLRVNEEHVMTEADMAAILRSEEGTRKAVQDRNYYIMLSKCDDDKRRKSGERIMRLLQTEGPGIEQIAMMFCGLQERMPYRLEEGQ